MKSYALLILLLITGLWSAAQKKGIGSIKGKVIDAQTKQPLPDATIALLSREDSVAVGFAVADKTGVFEIKNINIGSYITAITFTGYRQYLKNIAITEENPIILLDTIIMAADTSMLQSVVIVVPPISIKNDTIEFRAGAFKTKPNATVEDLLKKLPGVETDKDGNVTAQGEEVTKIYVDGKEFFSNDPKVAIKNLTAELVESIQVFDDMSDQAKFTRIDDGSRQKTINIKLKKNRKRGFFGRTSIGAGNSERYEASASVNMFDDKTQLSLLGGANNINRLGFTFNDLIANSGGMGSFNGNNNTRSGFNAGNGRNFSLRGNAGNGNTHSWNTGINFRDVWGPKMNFSGNYFVSGNTNVSQTNSNRQNFFPEDSIAYNNRESYSKNSSVSHHVNLRWEYTIDSMNSILITPVISMQHSESMSHDTLTTIATSPEFNYKAISGTSDRTNGRDGWNISNTTLFRHRFRKPGRTFTIGWSTSANESDGEGFNASPYYFYKPDSSYRFQNRNQRNDQLTRSFNNTISTSITEIIDKNKIFELNYAWSTNKSTNDQDTYDYNAISGKFDSVNKPQTSYFENVFTSSRIGTNFRVKEKKYDFQLGGAVQFASLQNLSNRATTGKDSMMEQRYTNFFPNASFNYNLGTRKSIRFNYRGSTQAPTVLQLQDVLDVSNQLVYRTGNPNLKQQFNHNLNFSFNTFNVTNFIYINTNITANITGNKIVNSRDTIEHAIQLVKPENLNGAMSLAATGTIGIPLKKATTGRRSPLNLNLTTSIRYSRDVSKLYGQFNYSYTRSIGQRFNFNYNIQDKLDMSAVVNLNYNDAKYDVRQDLNNKYFNHNYSLDITYTFFKRMMLNSDFDYYLVTGRADGFNQGIPMWNAYLSCLLFPKKNGEIRLSVADILNQNKSINRNIGDNYLEDTYTQVLRRFFLVSFLYNFNKFSGGANAPQGRRTGGNQRGGYNGSGGNGGGNRSGGSGGGRRP